MSSKKYKIFLYILSTSLILSSLPIFVFIFASPVEFNQFLIQRIRITTGNAGREEILQGLSSMYDAGLNFIKERNYEQPDFDDEKAVFEYIFEMLPHKVKVYPTEGFYYWNTRLKDAGDISGNLRLADLKQGKISFAYFTVNSNEQRTKYYSVDVESGLKVLEVEGGDFIVSYNNKEVFISMPEINVTKLPLLIEKEEFIGRIYDESAVGLFLIYNSETNSFYEILDESTGPYEEYEEIGNNLLLGTRTAFIYYSDSDTNRKILVGTYLLNGESNNYLDGPGDQVPYWLNFKDKLNVAYPATMLGEGIDDHGVYLKRKQWMRIAVSPYHRYMEISEIDRIVLRCQSISENSYRLTCLTKEWWNNYKFLERTADKLTQEGKSLPSLIFEKAKFYESKTRQERT